MKKEANNLDIKRHGCSHILAAAVLELYPKVKLGIGPAIENGFYYDFDFPEPIEEKDLEKISALMGKIIQKDLSFIKSEVNIDEAQKIFKDQPYKLDLIEDLAKEGNKKVSLYKTGDFVDLCAGPHVEKTSDIGAFKLLSLAGAYWKSSEKNKMLTRIYGACFSTKEELEKYLWQIEEAKKRDHRKIGKELDLFHIDEMVGLGLPLWHFKGAKLWRIIENFWHDVHEKAGYNLVRTPHIGNKILWETSGHWKFYNETMYSPIEAGQSLSENQNQEKVKESETYLLKPMNCPFHIQIYKNSLHSYRELPLRFAECGTVYRFEKKGELSGLTRVRGFTQDDAHIICQSDQVEKELEQVIDLILFIYQSFKFKIEDINVYLSVRDPQNDKYAGSPKDWEFTEKVLEKIAKKKNLAYKKDIGGAVFYGPKLDFKIKDVLEREWQCSTLQFDFNLPERFNMDFTNAHGKKERPYMLHHAIFGSFERFIGLLIEHFGGAFPTWLAPIQVKVLNINDSQNEEAQEIVDQLQKEGIRAEKDNKPATLGAKIREAEVEKIPYILVVGDKEIKEKSVSVRARGEKNIGSMKIEKFIELLKEDIAKKR